MLSVSRCRVTGQESRWNGNSLPGSGRPPIASNGPVRKTTVKIEETHKGVRNVMRLIKYLIAAASGIVLMGLNTGCSSVMCGSSQSVSIKSRPAGAEVLVYNPECQVVC